MVWQDIFTVISNIGFLFPAAEAIERQYWIEAIIYLIVTLSSTFYHLCNSWSGACLGLPPDVLRDQDFFWAQLLIPLIALYAIKPWSEHWYAFKICTISITAVGLFYAQRYWGNSPYVQMAVAAASFGAIFFYWLLYALRQSRKPPKKDGSRRRWLPPYRWEYFSLGLGLSGVAVALFSAEMLNHELYWAIHSCWHLDAAFGQFFLLCIWRTPSEPIRLYDPKHPGRPGKRVPLMESHPYAIRSSNKLIHLTPPSKM